MLRKRGAASKDAGSSIRDLLKSGFIYSNIPSHFDSSIAPGYNGAHYSFIEY
jgi:hypothetical protein